MPRRPRLPPDTRPDWRDPNMPVLVQHRTDGLISISKERVTNVSIARMQINPMPNWHNDPTYNLRKRGRK